jgi:hypothetical protein
MPGRLLTIVILFACIAVASATPLPAPFAPIPVKSGERLQDVTETSDGHTMFLTISGAKAATIVQLVRRGAGWQPNGVAPFSGIWRDLEEVLTPNGSAMIFASNRPLPGSTRALDAYYGRQYHAGAGGHLWVVQRTAKGWGTPMPLPSAINANTSVFSPAIAGDGTLYFMRATGKAGLFHIFASRPPYRAATLAPFASKTAAEFDPTVSPDGTVVIFSSTRFPLPQGTSHLFVTHRRGASWTTPRDLGGAINLTPHNIEARLLPGNRLCYNSTKTLYCTLDW